MIWIFCSCLTTFVFFSVLWAENHLYVISAVAEEENQIQTDETFYYAEKIKTFADPLSAFRKKANFLQQTGGQGQRVTISIRGIQPKYTKYLWQGLPIETSGDLSLIPIELYDTYIHEGNLCAIYGNGATAGVVNISSSQPLQKNNGGQATFKIGSQNNRHVLFTQKLTDKNQSFTLRTSLHNKHNTSSLPKRWQNEFNQENTSFYKNTTVSGTYDFDSDRAKTEIIFFHQGRISQTNDLMQNPIDYRTKADFNFMAAALSLEGFENTRPFLKVLSQHLKQDMFHTCNPRFFYKPRITNQVAEFGGDIFINNFTYTPSIFSQHKQSWQPDKKNSETQKNYSFIQTLKFEGNAYETANTLRADKHQDFKVKYVWRTHHKYTLNKMFSLYGSISTGYSQPTYLESHHPVYGNKDLKREKSASKEIGTIITINPQHAIDFKIYSTKLSNVISFFDRYINNGNLYYHGMQVSHAYQYGNFNVQSTVNCVRNKQYNKVLAFKNFQPKHLVSQHISYTFHKWTYLLGWQYRSCVVQSDPKNFSLYHKRGGLLTTFFNTTKEINGFSMAFLNIDNLLNKKIEEPYGYKQPGLNFVAGVTFKW